MEIATVEAPHIPEKAQTTPSPEFSRRILLGPSQKEALNPNAPLAPITREALGSLKDRDYTLYNTKSDAERDAFWSTKAEISCGVKVLPFISTLTDSFLPALMV